MDMNAYDCLLQTHWKDFYLLRSAQVVNAVLKALTWVHRFIPRERKSTDQVFATVLRILVSATG
jgi:hypothetical protein